MTAATPPPARVQVLAQEFSFTLSRLTLAAAPAIVELVNRGEDAHDLRMQPGAHADREYNLLPGAYVLWCAVADHRQRGMTAKLVVRRRVD